LVFYISIRARVLASVIFLFLAGSAPGGHLQTEAEYQATWRPTVNGEIEFILPDRTRCDC
jgi:hypothetical protein